MATYILPATTTVESGGRFTASGPSTLTGAITLTGNIVTDLLFTDATFDIGKTGATRPRDFFLSRNATIGGTASVVGKATFTVAPMVPASAGTAVYGLDCTDTAVSTVANNGTYTPDGGGNTFSGLMVINDITSGNIALLLGGTAIPTLVAQNATEFTITGGTGGKTNITAAGGVLTVENKTGASADYRVLLLRTRVSA